jgi:hypothetical protein
MSFADVANKFRDCATYSRSRINAEKIIRIVDGLEAAEDMRLLTELFS